MAIGEVMLSLGLIDKEFKNGLTKAENNLKKSMSSMKNIVMGAALGKYLFSGAAQQAQEEFDLITTKLSIMKEGLISNEMMDSLSGIIDQFDYLGKGASEATIALTKFIQTGKATSLQTLGIYLDNTDKAMLSAMSTTERFNWVLENMPDRIAEITGALSDSTRTQLEFQKVSDDLRKSLGTAFVSVLIKITDAFGGLIPTMKMAIIAFTAYKTATILGNVGIGISKAIAMGSVWSAPAAIAMGVGALASISALIGGASLAVSALNGIQPPNASGNKETAAPNVIVKVEKDKFGEVQQVVQSASGGSSSSIQSKF